MGKNEKSNQCEKEKRKPLKKSYEKRIYPKRAFKRQFQ